MSGDQSCRHCGAHNADGRALCERCGGALAADRPKTPTGASEPGRYLGRMISQRYRVVERIARGGMGEVYVAEHADMQQLVAVKFLHKRYAHDESFAARFFNEARYAAQVTHPNAVALYDFGRLDDGTLFIVMEYVRGESLSRVVRAQGMIPVPMALRIASQIAEVLASAHEKRIIHRDVKPDNIMLVQGVGGRVSVKVLDFGIAKILDDEDGHHTEPGIMFGTPEYMSPEQALGHTYDHRVDVYALGLVMYYMLAGNPPFSGANKLAVLQAQVREQAPPLERSAKQPIPKRLVQLIDRMLAKTPESRPADMIAVLQELDAIQAADEQPSVDESSVLAWSSVPTPARTRTHTQELVRGLEHDHVAAVEQLVAAAALDPRFQSVRAPDAPDATPSVSASSMPAAGSGVAAPADVVHPAGPSSALRASALAYDASLPSRTSTPMSQKRSAQDWTPIAPARDEKPLGAVARHADSHYTLTGGGTYKNATPLTFNPLKSLGFKPVRVESGLAIAGAVLICGVIVFGALIVAMKRAAVPDEPSNVATATEPTAPTAPPVEAAEAEEGAIASARSPDGSTAGRPVSRFDSQIDEARRALADGKLAAARAALAGIPSNADAPRFSETRALLLRAESLEREVKAALDAQRCDEARDAQQALRTDVSASLAASHDAAIRRCAPPSSAVSATSAPPRASSPAASTSASAPAAPSRPATPAPSAPAPSTPAPSTPAPSTPAPSTPAPSRLPDAFDTPPARPSTPAVTPPAAPSTPAVTPSAPPPPADVLPPMEL